MKNLTQITLIFSVLTLSNAALAQVDIGGDVEQTASAKNSPFTALSIGKDTESKAKANDISGNVKINGSVKQKLDLKNSPFTSLSIGPGAKSEVGVNMIQGK